MKAETYLAELADGTFEFEDLYNDYLIEKQLEKQEYWAGIKANSDSHYFAPSMIWMCYLKQFLNTKMPQGVNLEALKIFDYGDMFQDHLIAKVFNWKFGDMHKAERSVALCIDPMRIYLGGRIDDLMIFKGKHGDKRIFIPIEGKSQAGGVQFRKSPKLEHIYQLTVYMISQGWRDGYLIYVNRSGLCDVDETGKHHTISKTFHIKLDMENWVIIVDRCETLADFYDNDKLPQPESRIMRDRKGECQYCPHKKLCDWIMAHSKEVYEAENYSELMKIYPEKFYEEKP